MQIQQLIFSQLQAEGFLPNYRDGDIFFKYEGKLLIIHENESDQNFMKVSLPSIHDIENEEDLVGCLKIANEISKKIKVVKAFVNNNNIWLTAELFIESKPDLSEILMRAIVVCKAGQEYFQEAYHKKSSLLNSLALN
jgi:hypothetical protein